MAPRETLRMRGLYVVAAVTMAGVSSVFALLAELEKCYGLANADLGWIAGAAFVAALITQLSLSRYAGVAHAERRVGPARARPNWRTAA
jgi:hypothetical protein